MKNKIIDYFFTIANGLFFLGIVISSILIINDAKEFIDSPLGYDGKKYTLFIPFIVLLQGMFFHASTLVILVLAFHSFIKWIIKH